MGDTEKPTRSRKRKRDTQNEALEAILERLNTLEQRLNAPPPAVSPVTPQRELPALLNNITTESSVRDFGSTVNRASASRESTATSEDAAGRIADAITSLVKVRSNNYFISNFDPQIHNIDVWCEEVDRAKDINRWDDIECLSRIGNNLKGDAKKWLHDWSSTDRSWSNFKNDFKPLCPRSIDIANIIFEVMVTDSKSYETYAEYARRTLLRLGLVKSLSDDIIVAIILRGISDPHIKAAATNANLKPNELVQFLSIYVKPTNHSKTTHDSHRTSRPGGSPIGRRNFSRRSDTDFKCHFCGKFGHKRADCNSANRQRVSSNNASKSSELPSTSTSFSNKYCTFCKKNGHMVDECFAKQRSESRNKSS